MNESRPFSERLHQDAQLGELKDADVRYVLIRADTLMGLFKNVAGPSRVETLEAFADSVRLYGGKSARRYAQDCAAEPLELLTVVAQTAASLGWGRWEFSYSTAPRLELVVENSPFAAGYGQSNTPVCAPITGMCSALGEMLLGAQAHAFEQECMSNGASCCRFCVEPG